MIDGTPPGDRDRAEELFLEALEREPGERRRFLDRACPEDPETRREVESLLAAHGTRGPVDRLADRLGGHLRAPLLQAGAKVGPYRVVREIGRGGMGVVYLAERTDPQDPKFRRSVALKVVRAGPADVDLRKRFLRERRILAGLSHPDIASVLDGGVSDDGLPYLVTEYVDGLPLHRYCDEQRLDLETRLRLFCDVCRAVHHAHRNLVVHRDLKPGNVLVTPEGRPKLLDFGIAKLLSDGEDGGSTLTRTGQLPMTPRYASPEQVRGGEPVTTATDVYALGVLLYELLTGHRPYAVDGTSPGELERIVCEVEPDAPSTAVERTEETSPGRGGSVPARPEAVSRARATEPSRLRRRLSGDLDTIVLKALRKEPERRYVSAAALADDVERHLSGRPVEARPDSLRYRASKFIRRHRAGVTAAALVLLSLLGGLAVAGWQARRAAEQARIAAAERDRAEKEAETAERVSGFLVDLFEASDPTTARDAPTTAEELLERGRERMREDEELADQPAVRAAMLDILGQVYRNTGRYEKARALGEDALALRRATPGVDAEDVAQSLTTLGILALEERQLEEADTLLREALEIRRRSLGPDHPDVASALNNLAAVHLFRGELDSAAARLREAIGIRQRLPGGAAPELAPNLDGLAVVMARRGDFEAADTLHRKALEIWRAAFPAGHPEVARSLGNVAVNLHRTGDYAAAEPLLREALEIWREAVEEHPQVAEYLNNLAANLEAQGKLEEAEARYREALALKRKVRGDAHPSTAITLNNLGLLLQKRGAFEAAGELLRESLRIRRASLGDEHPDVARSVHNLATLLADRDDCASAEPLLREALSIRRAALPDGHPRTASTLEALGECLLRLGRHAEAEEPLLEAYASLRKNAGSDESVGSDAPLHEALRRLLELYEAQGRETEAERYRAQLAALDGGG